MNDHSLTDWKLNARPFVKLKRENKVRMFLCTVCDKQYITKTGLAAHRSRHTGDELYSCNICGNCYSSETDVHRHMYIHSGRYVSTRMNIHMPSAQIVANVFSAVAIWQFTIVFIQERNRLTVMCVANDSHSRLTFVVTTEFTVDRNVSRVSQDV